jgi:hypothetical protein
VVFVYFLALRLCEIGQESLFGIILGQEIIGVNTVTNNAKK